MLKNIAFIFSFLYFYFVFYLTNLKMVFVFPRTFVTSLQI